MNKSIAERSGFYISRISLCLLVLLAVYFYVLVSFFIHPESEVSMMGTLPLFLSLVILGFILFAGEFIRLITFIIGGLPVKLRERIVHFLLLIISGFCTLPFAYRILQNVLFG